MCRSKFPKVGIIDKDINFHNYVELRLNYSKITIDYYADVNAYLNNIKSKQTRCIFAGIYNHYDIQLYLPILHNDEAPHIIFMLPNDDISLAVCAMKQGAFDVLVKPATERILRNIIFYAIARHKSD